MAERLALPTSDHGVAGSNPAGGEILPKPKWRFIAQSLSCSPFHRLEMTEILLKGRKTLTHPFMICTFVVRIWHETHELPFQMFKAHSLATLNVQDPHLTLPDGTTAKPEPHRFFKHKVSGISFGQEKKVVCFLFSACHYFKPSDP